MYNAKSLVAGARAHLLAAREAAAERRGHERAEQSRSPARATACSQRSFGGS